MTKTIIRRPNKTEFNTWSDVYKSYLDFYKITIDKNKLETTWSWINADNPQMYCFVAEVDNKVVGLAHFRKFIRPTEAISGIFLDDLIVLPDYRSKKIGYELISKIKSHAKENNISLIRWVTAHDNHQAMKLYDSVANKTSWVTYDLDIN